MREIILEWISVMSYIGSVLANHLIRIPQITGFPTLKLFSTVVPGGPWTYDGIRRAKDILAWVVRRTLPRVATVTMATLREIINAEQLVVLGLFTVRLIVC